MKYKDKCLDHIDSIERVNKEVMTLIQEAIVMNNVSSLNKCVSLLGNNDDNRWYTI